MGLLEASRDAPFTLSTHRVGPVTEAIVSPTAIQHHPTPGSIQWSEDNGKGEAEILLESLQIAGRSPQVSEDILDWPIFEGKYDRSRTESLIFNPRQSSDNEGSAPTINEDPVRTVLPGRGIREEDVPSLINVFLTNVHIKNPILNSDDIKGKGRWMSEHGFGWDAASCLVVSRSLLKRLHHTDRKACCMRSWKHFIYIYY